MNTITKVVGALTLMASSIYGGARFNEYRSKTAPFVVEKQGEAYYFIDKEKERAFPAEEISSTYDKFNNIKKAVEDYNKKIQNDARSLDAIIK